MEQPPHCGRTIVEALEVLWKADCPRPGSGGADVGYVIKLNPAGELVSVEIGISDRLLGRLLDESN